MGPAVFGVGQGPDGFGEPIRYVRCGERLGEGRVEEHVSSVSLVRSRRYVGV